MSVRVSSLLAFAGCGLLILGCGSKGGGSGVGGAGSSGISSAPGSPPPPGGTSMPPPPAPPPPSPAQPVVLNGDLIMAEAHHHAAIYFPNPFFHFFVKNTGTVPVTVPISVNQDGVSAFTSSFPVQPGEFHEQFFYPFDSPLPGAAAGMHSYTLVLDPGHTIQTTHPTTNDFVAIVDVPSGDFTWDFSGSNANLSNLRWTYEGPHVHGPFGGTFLLHVQILNNSQTASAACTYTVEREGVAVTPRNSTGTGPMDMNVPALAPGQESDSFLGIWNEPSGATGQVTWTSTIKPTDTEAYSGDKSRSYIVVLGLTSTGDPPGTP